MIATRLNRALDAIAASVSLLLGLALMLAVVINVANVIGRYGFNRPIEGADEVQIFLMIGLAFLGALVAHIRHRHLRMDVLARRFPPALARAAAAAEALAAVAVCGLLTWVSFEYTLRIWRLGSHSENAGIPMWIPHSVLVIAFGAMTLVGAARLLAPRAADPRRMSLTLGILPIALLLLGFPIFLVLLCAVVATLLLFMHTPLLVLPQTLFGALNVFTLLAIPFFIFTGELMGRGSVARRLVDLVNAGVGRVPGGLGVTTICSSALFGAMSGLSAASVATIGRAMLPALAKAGYPAAFSAGLLTSMGAIDVVIPPSIPLLVYGTAAQQSVPRLYAAGLGPALLLTVMLCGFVMLYCWRHGISGAQAFRLAGLGRAAVRGITALGAPIIIFGGIYGGVFTPTEAAAVACVYAAGVPVLIYRELGWRDILDCAQSTALFTGQILTIVACAILFGWVLTINQIPAELTGWLVGLHLPLWSLLLSINVLLLLVGSFMDPISAILLLTPLLVPLVKALGVDPVHFGIIFAVNLGIGLFHPPFGINIFVAQTVLGIRLELIYRGIIPFVFVYLAALGLITYIPAISMIGPRLLMH